MENIEQRKKIKLLMIIGLFHPFVGGAEKECQKLSKRLMDKGISVTVLTQWSDSLPEYEVIDGISIFRKIKGWHLFEISYMVSVLYFLLKNRKNFDVIQCYGLYLFIPPVVLIKYLFRKRVMARVEGPGRYGDFHRISQLRCGALILASARRLDKIIAVSRDLYREIINNGFPEKSIVNIPNSVDIDFFHPGKDDGKRNLGKITFVGRLEEEKGLEYLIQSLKIVKMELDHVKLFIVGSGQLQDELETLRQKLGLEDDDLAIVGHSNDVLSYYQETDLFVLPSLSEGLSLSLLEAMSCGLPVVATLVGGNTEIVDSHFEAGKTPVKDYHIGEHGILVNPRDARGLAKALMRLLKDDSLSKQLGSRARTLVENKFSLEKIVNEYVGLYSRPA